MVEAVERARAAVRVAVGGRVDDAAGIVGGAGRVVAALALGETAADGRAAPGAVGALDRAAAPERRDAVEDVAWAGTG